jgi:hypothetical protein
MLIDEGESEEDREISQEGESGGSSGINYFRNSPGRAKANEEKPGVGKAGGDKVGEDAGGNGEIKKLLDSLIASKSQY